MSIAVPMRWSSCAMCTRPRNHRPPRRSRCWWSRCPCRGPRRWRGSRYPTPWSSGCGRARPSSRSWSMVTVSRPRSVRGRQRCPPRSLGPCCYATATAASPAARSATSRDPSPPTPITGWQRRDPEPRRGVRRRRASRPARPHRQVGARGQPQPARRSPARGARRPHPRRSPRTRASTTARRAERGLTVTRAWRWSGPDRGSSLRARPCAGARCAASPRRTRRRR